MREQEFIPSPFDKGTIAEIKSKYANIFALELYGALNWGLKGLTNDGITYPYIVITDINGSIFDISGVSDGSHVFNDDEILAKLTKPTNGLLDIPRFEQFDDIYSPEALEKLDKYELALITDVVSEYLEWLGELGFLFDAIADDEYFLFLESPEALDEGVLELIDSTGLSAYMKRRWASFLIEEDAVDRIHDLDIRPSEAYADEIIFVPADDSIAPLFHAFTVYVNLPYYLLEENEEGDSTHLIRFEWQQWISMELQRDDFFATIYDFREISAAYVHKRPLFVQPYFEEEIIEEVLFNGRILDNAEPQNGDAVILHRSGVWEHADWMIPADNLIMNPFSAFTPEGLLDYRALMGTVYLVNGLGK